MLNVHKIDISLRCFGNSLGMRSCNSITPPWHLSLGPLVRGCFFWAASDPQMPAMKCQAIFNNNTHKIHVWHIYLHLVGFYGKCRWIFHTWILWDSNDPHPHPSTESSSIHRNQNEPIGCHPYWQNSQYADPSEVVFVSFLRTRENPGVTISFWCGSP